MNILFQTEVRFHISMLSGAPVHRALDKLHSFVPEATLYLLGRNLPNEVEIFLTVLRPRVAPRTKGFQDDHSQ